MTLECVYVELYCELWEDSEGCDYIPVARQRWTNEWHYLCKRHACQPIPDELADKIRRCGKPATTPLFNGEGQGVCDEHRSEYGFE